MIVVLGPTHSTCEGRWAWNTAIVGDISPLGAQRFLGSYHAAPGPSPEAYAAKVAARTNGCREVDVYDGAGWRIGVLRRRIRVSEQWLEDYGEAGYARVCEEMRTGAALIEVIR